MNTLKQMDWKNIGTRAGWTALQAFLAVILIGLEPILDLVLKGDWTGSWTAFLALMVAGVAAGISAVKTILVELSIKLRG